MIENHVIRYFIVNEPIVEMSTWSKRKAEAVVISLPIPIELV